MSVGLCRPRGGEDPVPPPEPPDGGTPLLAPLSPTLDPWTSTFLPDSQPAQTPYRKWGPGVEEDQVGAGAEACCPHPTPEPTLSGLPPHTAAQRQYVLASQPGVPEPWIQGPPGPSFGLCGLPVATNC